MYLPIKRVSAAHPCPICGKPDWCSLGVKVAFCMRVPYYNDKGKLCLAKNGAYIHPLSGHRPPSLPPPSPPKPLAPLDRLDQVYRHLLGCLTLDDRHMDNLLARGLSPEAIARNCYRSLPLNGRGELVKRVVQAVGAPKGVPGFFRWNSTWELAGWPGMLIPARNLDGLVQGFQIRVDEPTEQTGKYPWLSSHKQGGWSPGAPAHIARPTKLTDRSVWVTEGALKADVAAEYLKAVVVGVAGVGNWRTALGPIWYLLCYAEEQEVVIAFDQDDDPDKVERAEKFRDALAEQIRESGMRAHWARWDSGKGIDDAKAAGAKVEIWPTGLG